MEVPEDVDHLIRSWAKRNRLWYLFSVPFLLKSEPQIYHLFSSHC